MPHPPSTIVRMQPDAAPQLPVSPRVSAVGTTPSKPATAASIEKAIKVTIPSRPTPPSPVANLNPSLSLQKVVRDNARAINAAAPPAQLPSPHLTPRERSMSAHPAPASASARQQLASLGSRVTLNRLQNPQFQGTPSSAAVALLQPAFPGRGASERHGKEKVKKRVVLDAAAAAVEALAAAKADYDAARAAMGKLKAKSVADVCRLSHAPPAVRQLLQAACAAMGERGWGCGVMARCLGILRHRACSKLLNPVQANRVILSQTPAWSTCHVPVCSSGWLTCSLLLLTLLQRRRLKNIWLGGCCCCCCFR